MRKRLAAVLTALCVLTVACGDDGGGTSGAGNTPADAPAESQADPNGVIRMGYDLAAASRGGVQFNPAASASITSDFGLYHWIYGALMRPTPEGALEPDLAKSATLVDTTTIEVVIRDGLTFSDGTPLSAETVKAAIERNLANTTAKAFRPGFFSLKSIELTAPNTLRLGIPDGTAASWYDLSLPGPETMTVPEGADFTKPVGAGPLTVAEFVPQQRLVLKKNPAYWDAGRIQVGGIELINTPDAQTGVSALSAGQVDWARLDYSLVDAAASDVKLLIEPDPMMLTQMLICKSTAPLDDVRVRKALNLAIDREAIGEAIFGGTAQPAWDLWPEGHRLHNDELTGRYKFDPDAAEKLLGEAGFAGGLTVDVIPIQGANVPEIVQVVQQQWAQVGVTMNIVQSTNFVQDFLRSSQTPLGAIPQSGTGRGKLENFVGESVGNACQYQDPELVKLRDDLAKVSDTTEEAAQIWGKMEDIIVDDALSVLILFQPRVFGYREQALGGYALVPYGIPVPDLWSTYVKA